MKYVRLAIAVAIIGVVWLKLLPTWAAQPKMRESLARQEARGINGNAIYYTESPAALSGLETLRSLRQEQPDLMWRPSRSRERTP